MVIEKSITLNFNKRSQIGSLNMLQGELITLNSHYWKAITMVGFWLWTERASQDLFAQHALSFFSNTPRKINAPRYTVMEN